MIVGLSASNDILFTLICRWESNGIPFQIRWTIELRNDAVLRSLADRNATILFYDRCPIGLNGSVLTIAGGSVFAMIYLRSSADRNAPQSFRCGG